MSRVDVIVPCYNYGRYLRDCVESVLDQPVDLRVLIVDDASTDDTEAIARDLVGRDPRVEYRRHHVNQGAIATYNEGLRWVGGDYHLTLSADDALVPGALARAARFLDSEPSVGFVFGREIRFESSGPKRPPQTTSEYSSGKVIKSLEFIEASCIHARNFVPTPTAVLRSSLLGRVGFFRPDLAYVADMTMWLMYASHADVGLLDAEQAYYRLHSENMSLTVDKNFLLRHVRHKAAFDALLEHAGQRLPELETLRNKAYRAIGLNVLNVATREFNRGDWARSREAIEFAVACWPDVVHQKKYHRLRIKSWIGPSGWNLLRRVTFRPRLDAPRAETPVPRIIMELDHVSDFEKAIGELR
jgi:glycosyltransferase involved in cell wall biosynthesis